MEIRRGETTLIRNVGTGPKSKRKCVYPVVPRYIPGCEDARAFFHSVLCCHADCKEELLIKSHRGTALDTSQIIVTARQKGWQADKHGYALCPTHAKAKGKLKSGDRPNLSPQQKRAAYLKIRMREEADKLRERQRERDFINNGSISKPTIIIPITDDEEKEVSVVVLEGARAEAPRQPELSERQRILEVLEEVYDKREQCYVGAETDEAVAKRINVPRKWVSEIRDMFFGPEGNQVSDILRAEVAEYVSKCTQVSKDALNIAERAEELEKFGRQLQEKVGVPLPPKR